MLNKQKLLEENEQKKLDIYPEAVSFLIIGLIEIRETIEEAIDCYIERRIKSDKVIMGLIRDLENAVRNLEPKN